MGFSASDVALFTRVERERVHLLLIDDAKRGLADIAARRTDDADKAIELIQQRRKTCQPVHRLR